MKKKRPCLLCVSNAKKDVSVSGFHLRVKTTSCLFWFCITMLRNLFKELKPLSQPIRSKSKPIVTCSSTFPHALHQLCASAWFTGLCVVSFVLNQSYYSQLLPCGHPARLASIYLSNKLLFIFIRFGDFKQF